jgi:hypothetical protein
MHKRTFPVVGNGPPVQCTIIEAAEVSASDDNADALHSLLGALPVGPVIVGIIREYDLEVREMLEEKFDEVITARDRTYGRFFGEVRPRVLTALVYEVEFFVDAESGLCLRTRPTGEEEEQVYCIQLEDDVVVFEPSGRNTAGAYRQVLEKLPPSTATRPTIKGELVPEYAALRPGPGPDQHD